MAMAPWQRETVYWDGVLKLAVSGDSTGVTRTLTVTDPRPNDESSMVAILGMETTGRALALLEWGFKTGTAGHAAGPCPDEALRKAGVCVVDKPNRDFRGKNAYHIHGPMLTRCSTCGSPSGWWTKEPGQSTALPAFLLGLANWANGANRWDNPAPPLEICTCAAISAELEALPWPETLQADTGWTGTSAGRCIVDFVRTLTFSAPLTPSETRIVLMKVRHGKAPGNDAPKAVISEDLKTLIFRTTSDSSD